MVSSQEDLAIISAKVNEKFSILELALYAANANLAKHIMSEYPEIVPAINTEESKRLLRYTNALDDATVADMLKAVMRNHKC